MQRTKQRAAATTILWAINYSNHLAQNDLVTRLEKCKLQLQHFISQCTFIGGKVRVAFPNRIRC